MDKDVLLARLGELKEQMAEITRRLEALDELYADGVTDEAVKKYADELLKILDDREPIIAEARQLLLISEGLTDSSASS